MDRSETEFRKADLRGATRDAQDPTLTLAERATARAAMNDHLDALGRAEDDEPDAQQCPTDINGEQCCYDAGHDGPCELATDVMWRSADTAYES